MTGVPKKRYYLIITATIVVGALLFAGLLLYVREADRQAAAHDAARIEAYARQFSYRSCVDRNELRAVIATILQGALDRPRQSAATPEGRAQERAYRALIRSYLIGGELVPLDCTSILKGGHPQ
jgi:hypothetical protein